MIHVQDVQQACAIARQLSRVCDALAIDKLEVLAALQGPPRAIRDAFPDYADYNPDDDPYFWEVEDL